MRTSQKLLAALSLLGILLLGGGSLFAQNSGGPEAEKDAQGEPVIEEQNPFEETVVTAYGGRQLRSKVTGSISSVTGETLTSGMHTNAASALAGSVAGLRVQKTSVTPAPSRRSSSEAAPKWTAPAPRW